MLDNNRKWNVTIKVDGKWTPVDLTGVGDVERDTLQAAVEACRGVILRTWEFVPVQLFKSTKAHGQFVPDRTYQICWSPLTRDLVARKSW